MSNPPFREIWAVDFEFIHPDGECLKSVVCLVARELRSRRKVRLWQDQLGKNPPYSIAEDSLFVAFSAGAEISCHLFLGWAVPVRILDLRIEFLRTINTTPLTYERKRSRDLLLALTHYGLDGIDAAEKDYWRKMVTRGGPWSSAEKEGILNYCETDVAAVDRLLPAMVRRGDIDLPRAIYRGRYVPALAHMQLVGVPIDMDRLARYCGQEETIKARLVDTVGAQYGVYTEERCWSDKLFFSYLSRRGWGWPFLDSGRPDLKDKTWKAMAAVHPELETLRQLRYTLDKLKLNDLQVGSDGFNRCWLNPFGSRTSRNQPSNARFIFGPAVWLRDFLIQPKPGWGLAYIDWTSQEVGVAAALSGDLELQEAYHSGDLYLAFGRRAGVLPEDAAPETCCRRRDLCKTCVLGTQYGMKYRSLGERANVPDITARELLRLHRKVYHTMWAWSDNRANRSLLHSCQSTVFGWTHKFIDYPNINSVRNWPIQSNAAEMMRLAACLATEDGIQVCAPVHDAFLIMAPIPQLEGDARRMRRHMAEASRVVLSGFVLRTDEPHFTLYPNHYSDPKGRGKEMLSIVMNLLYAAVE